MRNDLAIFQGGQDTAKTAAADSMKASTGAANGASQAPEQFRTPENARFMYIAYSIAAVIYVSYLLILRGRWTALRKRQAAARQLPR